MPAPTSSATASTRPEPQRPTGSTSPITVSSTSPSTIFTPSIAPSAARMPQRIWAASNAGPAGAAVASARGRRAEHDLGVRADVDEEPDALVERQAGGEDAGDDVRPDVRAERREEHGRRALVHADAEVGGRRLRAGAAPRS